MTNEQILEDAKLAGFDIEKYKYNTVLLRLTKFAELTKAHSIPDGFVLVPIEPTESMILTGGMLLSNGAENRPELSWSDEAKMTYTAMIKAAQQERN